MKKSINKIMSMILILILPLAFIMPMVNNAQTGESLIKDESLLATIYDRNGDKRISKEELEAVQQLQIWEGTKDLSGLEYATNVYSLYYEYDGTNLDFSKVHTENITEVEVYVKDNNKFDLDFLSKFPKAVYLKMIADDVSTIDLSKLVNYQNLINVCLDIDNIEKIDGVTNLSNLQRLEIRVKGALDLKGISSLEKLEELVIQDGDLTNAKEIGNLKNLKSLTLSNCTGIANPSYLKNNTNLQYINMFYSDVSDVSFANNLKKLETLNLQSTNVTKVNALKNLPNLKELDLFDTNVSDAERINLMEFEDYTAYIGEKIYAEPKITGTMVFENWEYASSNEEIAETSENGAILAIQPGEAIITLTNKATGIAKEMKIIVRGVPSDQTLGNNSEAVQVADNMFLKANGELWKIYVTEAKAEKIDTNVEKYVSDVIFNGRDNLLYSIKLKKDGNAELTFNGITSTINNVKDIYKNGYLSKNGVYYELNLEGKWNKVTDNVESIVGSYLVKTDGKTYTVLGRKACDFKIIAANGTTVVDENKTIWKNSTSSIYSYKWEKLGENFKQYTDGTENSYKCLYETEDGKIMDTFGKESEYKKEIYCDSNKLRIDKNNNALLNDTVILNNVVSMQAIDDDNMVLIRVDGTVWGLKLNGKATLEQIVEQNKNVFLSNNNLKTKEIVSEVVEENVTTKEALMGFELDKLQVSDVMKNFNQEYTVKVLRENTEKTGTEKIATGDSIVLYNKENEPVQEYIVLIYGDVTGTGNPSAKDALTIIKNKTGKLVITNPLYLEAGRITETTRKTGAEPSSADALAIIKIKLGKYTVTV